jgi:hypothetical protein
MRYSEIIHEDAHKMGYTIDAYHGTNQDFDAFQLGKNARGNSGAREARLGFWFTDNPQVASDFADWASRGYYDGGSVMPVKLKISHPLVVQSYKEIMAIVDRFTKFNQPPHRMMQDKVDYEGARQWLKSEGYDGIILPNTLTDSPDEKTLTTQYIVFDPQQIRSRFARFDPTKADSDLLTDSRS